MKRAAMRPHLLETVFQIDAAPDAPRRFAPVAGVAFRVQQQIDVLCAGLVIVQNAEIILRFVIVGPSLELFVCLVADAGVKVAQLHVQVFVAVR